MSNNIISTEESMSSSLSKINSLSFNIAKASLILASCFIFILGLLHIIKPEINPSWRFISEYAIGRHGWLMSLAFLILSASYISLFYPLKKILSKKIISRIGLGLMLISAIGLFVAGIFATDPIIATESEQSIEGKLHSLGGTMGIAMPFASLFICISLFRDRNLPFKKRPVLWTTMLALLGFVVASTSLALMLMQSGGKFGPEVLVGWPNRFEIITYCIWLIVVAYQIMMMHVKFPESKQ